MDGFESLDFCLTQWFVLKNLAYKISTNESRSKSQIRIQSKGTKELEVKGEREERLEEAWEAFITSNQNWVPWNKKLVK
jgi:hypothetical protein